jgi:predicted CXXCH cytochrome family protein
MINKLLVHISINLIAVALIYNAGSAQNLNGEGILKEFTFKDVHSETGSKCDICHPPNMEIESSSVFLKSDLCLSCHSDVVVVLPNSILKSRIDRMDNHPIKFSPLDFDMNKFNHSIINAGGTFRIIGSAGSLPLFGNSLISAVVECSTCHDPHGKSGFPKLQRLDNDRGSLCLVCHLDL